MAAKKGLGKGMGDLLGTPNANNTKSKSGTMASQIAENTSEVDIDKISPNKEQPRKLFDEDALLELSESIKQHGIIEPLVVSRKKDTRGKEYFQIVAGERRWRAAKIANLKTVPVVIKEYSDKQILEIALIENIQREDLNPIEEAQAYSSLIQELKLTQDQLAERVAKSRTAITNSLRLLKLSKKVQQMVIDEKLSAGHVRALLSIEDKNLQYDLAQHIFDEGLSVRNTEKLVKKYTTDDSKKNDTASGKKKDSQDEAVQAIYKEKEKEVENHLKTKVSIEDRGNKGKIIISYNSLEEFERIYDILNGEES